ncbi:hypothetical protein [Catenuloplanes japonicus]|uniref:hypothetical protein n=1 Tax=Catenuloplanes japonicus TaxID=33876 RepID=UPI00052787E8|nr:hypothetical protein [Catenuloplanes japonicus]
MTAPAPAPVKPLTPGARTFTATYQIAGHNSSEQFAGVVTIGDGQTFDDIRDLLTGRFTDAMGVDRAAVTPLDLSLRRARGVR